MQCSGIFSTPLFALNGMMHDIKNSYHEHSWLTLLYYCRPDVAVDKAALILEELKRLES